MFVISRYLKPFTAVTVVVEARSDDVYPNKVQQLSMAVVQSEIDWLTEESASEQDASMPVASEI